MLLIVSITSTLHLKHCWLDTTPYNILHLKTSRVCTIKCTVHWIGSNAWVFAQTLGVPRNVYTTCWTIWSTARLYDFPYFLVQNIIVCTWPWIAEWTTAWQQIMLLCETDWRLDNKHIMIRYPELRFISRPWLPDELMIAKWRYHW